MHPINKHDVDPNTNKGDSHPRTNKMFLRALPNLPASNETCYLPNTIRRSVKRMLDGVDSTKYRSYAKGFAFPLNKVLKLCFTSPTGKQSISAISSITLSFHQKRYIVKDVKLDGDLLMRNP